MDMDEYVKVICVCVCVYSVFVCHLRDKSPASLSWPFARCISEPNQTAKPNNRLNMCFHFESRTHRKVRIANVENLAIFHI